MLFTEMMKGKSLLRTLTNEWLSKLTIDGHGIDLGSKSHASSYYRFIKKSDSCQILFTDMTPQTPEVITLNLEKPIPIENDTKDFLILMFVLEHLYDHNFCLSECYRILKPGKRLIGGVPFIYRVHLDPDDNFRFAQNGIEKILKQAGFSKIEIIPLGYGPFSAGTSLFSGIFKVKILVWAITYMSILADKFFQKIFKNHNRIKAENFPLAYGFIATK